jgi:hypothetical protein
LLRILKSIVGDLILLLLLPYSSRESAAAAAAIIISFLPQHCSLVTLLRLFNIHATM